MSDNGPTSIAKSARGAHKPSQDRKEMFNRGRHRWLGQVARDPGLSGSAVRVAILLWDMFNSAKGGAWPSIAYIAKTLTMDRSTVMRAIKALDERGWLIRRSGNRHRSNFYLPGFGNSKDKDTAREAEDADADARGSRPATGSSHRGNNKVAALQP